MIILTQNNDAIYDTSNCSALYIEENTIYLSNYTGEIAYELGKYDNEERCKAIIEEIFTFLRCQDKYVMPFV